MAASATDPFVIVNPRAGKGRGATLVEPVLRALAPVEHALTQQAGDEARLTTEAIARGHRTIVAVGGDGTWSHVGNAILRSGVPGVRLGLVSGGTGSDLAKSLGIPGRDLLACARIVRAGRTRRIDVGRIGDRFFLNVSGFGYDIAVIEDARAVTWLSGHAVYLYCSVKQLGSFPGFPVEIGIDGVPPVRRELLMLIVANARVFGGGFKIAPKAELDDGLLDAMCFANMGVLRRFALMGRLLRGTHESAPEVESRRVRALELRFAAPPKYETDGESNQAKESVIRVEAVPRALEVLVP